MSYPYQKHVWVTKEVIRREYMQNISDGIFDEQQERLTSEAQINSDITAESNRAKGAEQNITNALNAETARAEAAETSLSSSLSDEVTRASGAESAIASDVSTLQTDLTSEVSRATGAESGLSTRITDEVTRATEAESSLSTQISNEVTRAINAEDALRTTLTSTYKASGSVLFADLPPLDESRQGNVYDIKDAFTTTEYFVEGAGNNYPAGTNVAIVRSEGDFYFEVTPVGTENPTTEGWYVLDDGEFVLSSDTEVVSGTTYYEYSDYAYLYDVMPGFIDTSHFITDTDYATSQNAGIMKPDGTTTSVNANGVLSVVGGSGHTIVDSNGTSFTQRTKLKVENGYVMDDATNDQTIIKDHDYVGTYANWQLLTSSEKAQYKFANFI